MKCQNRIQSNIININNDTKIELDKARVVRTSETVVTTLEEHRLNQQYTTCGQLVQQATLFQFLFGRKTCVVEM